MNEQDAQELYRFERPPLLIVISGTSGSGKDSVARALMARMREQGTPVHFVVTATTRPKRETEVDGIDYIFVSQSEFKDMIARDELIEYAVVYGQYKGVPKQQIREAMKAMTAGQDVVMRLDIQGAATIRQMTPDAVLIFITASSERELTRRLKRRDTETREQLQIRLETARKEMQHIPEFDYVIPNPDRKLDETVETVLTIVTAERYRTQRCRVRL